MAFPRRAVCSLSWRLQEEAGRVCQRGWLPTAAAAAIWRRGSPWAGEAQGGKAIRAGQAQGGPRAAQLHLPGRGSRQPLAFSEAGTLPRLQGASTESSSWLTEAEEERLNVKLFTMGRCSSRSPGRSSDVWNPRVAAGRRAWRETVLAGKKPACA